MSTLSVLCPEMCSQIIWCYEYLLIILVKYSNIFCNLLLYVRYILDLSNINLFWYIQLSFHQYIDIFTSKSDIYHSIIYFQQINTANVLLTMRQKCSHDQFHKHGSTIVYDKHNVIGVLLASSVKYPGYIACGMPNRQI